MKSMVGKAVVVVLLLAAVGGLAVWLAYGDDIAQSMSGGQQEAPPATAPVARETVQRVVTGVGEVKPIETEKLRPADSWHWLKSFDAPLNKRIAAGDTLVTYSNGEKWVAPYDMVVTSYELPKKNKGAVTKDDHYIEAQRIDSVGVALPVSESDLASLAEGQKVKVKLAADEEREYEGVISNINEVGTYGDTGSKFTVTVKVPNDGSIKLGMSANLAIGVAEAADALTVPVSAVNGAGEDKYVDVFDEETGETRQVPVATGITDGMIVEVAGEGLREGDLVVLNEEGADSSDAAGKPPVLVTADE